MKRTTGERKRCRGSRCALPRTPGARRAWCSGSGARDSSRSSVGVVHQVALERAGRDREQHLLVHEVVAPARVHAVEKARAPVGVALAVREPAAEEAVAPRHAVDRRHRRGERRSRSSAQARARRARRRRGTAPSRCSPAPPRTASGGRSRAIPSAPRARPCARRARPCRRSRTNRRPRSRRRTRGCRGRARGRPRRCG